MKSNRKKRIAAFAVTAAMITSSAMPILTEVCNTSVTKVAASSPILVEGTDFQLFGVDYALPEAEDIPFSLPASNTSFTGDTPPTVTKTKYGITITLNGGTVNCTAYFYNGLNTNTSNLAVTINVAGDTTINTSQNEGFSAIKIIFTGSKTLTAASKQDVIYFDSLCDFRNFGGIIKMKSDSSGNALYGYGSFYLPDTYRYKENETSDVPDDYITTSYNFDKNKKTDYLEFDCTLSSSSATVGNQTISGTTGAAITDQEVTIALVNATFTGTAKTENYDASGWFNLPTGLSAKVKSGATDTQLTVIISGTPTAASSEAMAITIPAAALPGNAQLIVTANADAKYNIATVPTLSGISVSLDDSFSVNVTADDEQFEEGGAFADYTVSLEVDDGHTTSTITSHGEDAQTGDYKFENVTDFCAKNLGDIFKVRLKAEKDGSETAYSAWKEYSVKDYLKSLIEGDYSAKTKTLAVDILNYGAAAQTYFDYGTDKLVNADLTDPQKALATSGDQGEIETALSTSTSDYTNPSEYYGTSLLLKDKVQLRHYITADTPPATGGWEGPKTFEGANRCYKTVEGITPLKFDEGMRVDDTYEYSVNRYIYDVLSTSGNENLKALAASLYKYGVSAEDYAKKTYTVTSISQADLDNDTKIAEIMTAIAASNITYDQAKEVVDQWKSKNTCEAEAYFLYDYVASEDLCKTVCWQNNSFGSWDNNKSTTTENLWMWKEYGTCGAYYITVTES